MANSLVSEVRTNLRTKEELEIAFQSLADEFYHRKIYGEVCEECQGTEVHGVSCSRGRGFTFQGWAQYVRKTKTPEGNCQQPECSSLATNRIRLNVWETLREYDVCDTHAKYDDGRSRDLSWCDGL